MTDKFDDQVNKNVEWAEEQTKPKPIEGEIVEIKEFVLPGQMPQHIFTNDLRNEDKNPAWRPTKWSPSFEQQAKILCSKGFTDIDLAEAFMVSPKTIVNWKKDYPEFLLSIKEGKDLMDAQVEKSLLQRAVGYAVKEEKVFCSEGAIVTHESIKHYPPETHAIKFWLTNRKPADWRDKHEVDFKSPFTLVMDEADQRTL